MKKKMLTLILAMAMVCSLAACGSSSGDTDTGNDTEAAVTEAAGESGEDSAEETAEAAEADVSGADTANLSGLTIGFSQSDNSSNWKIVETEDMQEKAAEYGINLVYTDASGDIAKQSSDIADMVAQNVDYLIVAPIEEDGLQSSLTDAMDAGIPVILVDRAVNGVAGTTFTTQIMSDFVWEAQQCAEYVINETGGTGNVVILEGTQGATSATDRQNGFMDTIEGTDLVVIADQVANFSMAEAQEVMENILQAQGSNIDILYCHGCDMAMGALTAIKAAGYTPGEDIKIVTVDASKDTMEAILAGEVLAACSCSPYFGDAAFGIISQMEAGDTVEESYTNTDTLYDITNASVDEGY